MKKFSLRVAMLLILSISSVVGYEVYKDSQLTSLLSFETEALGNNGEGDGYRYPEASGKAQECTMYVYVDLNTHASITLDSESPEFDASAQYTKYIKEGLKDKCPRRGNGCNPYTCSLIPYN